MTKRAAIYARMSTDKQSKDSPADQIAQCRDFAKGKGWEIVEDLVVEDPAISGASRHDRPRVLNLFERIDEWDVLIAWDVSRLSRNREDLGWMVNRAQAHRRRIVLVDTGKDLDDISSAIMGDFAHEFRRQVGAHTHKALRGKAERNLSAGGCPFGYERKKTEHGTRWVPDPAQAEVVKRIFRLYVEGKGFRAIARKLNAEAVPPPRRCSPRKERAWATSGVRAMLLNPIYRGEYIWNKTTKVMDHATRKIRTYKRPPSEWIHRSDEGWRIVSDELWHEAQSCMAARAETFRDERGPRGSSAGTGGKPRSFVAGLMSCGECGGAFHILYRDKLGCGRRHDSGSGVCGNASRVPVKALEARVVGAIRSQILVPDRIAYVIHEALDKVRRYAEQGRAAEADREGHKARLKELEDEIGNLVELAAELGDVKVVAPKIAERERERTEIRAALATPAVLDLDGLAEEIEGRVSDMRGLLDGSPEQGREVAQTLFGEERIRVYADAERGFRIEGSAVWALPSAVTVWCPGLESNQHSLARTRS